MISNNTWPPEQLKFFTPIRLVSYQGHRNPRQVMTMAKLMHTGEIGENQSIMHYFELGSHKRFQGDLNATIVTKGLEEILVTLEDKEKSGFILIEGAPGIGKSVLLKDIAYQWGKLHLLKVFKLVLLVHLNNLFLQKVKSIPDLLQHFCRGDPNATEITDACSKYFFNNGGEDLVFLFDGFDELPEKLQTDGLIADIINRLVLPCCGLVVSSRPHATRQLCQQAALRVDILGFSKEEQHAHIRGALHNQSHKINDFIKYLEDHLTVSSLCYVPSSLNVLLYLYELEIVPLLKHSAELWNYVIYLIIYRNLTKCGIYLPSSIAGLADLPQPYNRIIQQISKLSLEGLDDKKFIFTIDTIKAACPSVLDNIPGAINGFGLLQAVQHFNVTGTTITFNFLHSTIQEFLAAYYVSHLPPNEELKVIEARFWSDSHFNMFFTYIWLTKGERSSFKHFLCGGSKSIAISPEFLEDPLKCLQLHCYFNMAKDQGMCNIIETADIFHQRIIDLYDIRLTANNIDCLLLFLRSSFNKEWVKLDLTDCYIEDKGLNALCHGFLHSNAIINQLWLINNDLTAKSSRLISEVAVKKIKMLRVDGNHSVGEDKQFYAVLTDPSTVLEHLYMGDTKLSSRAAILLFTALKENNKLQLLDIAGNAIADDAVDAISMALKENCCLVTLRMHDNPLSEQAIATIVQCLADNNTLELLWLPDCHQDVKENISVKDDVNKVKVEVKFL